MSQAAIAQLAPAREADIPLILALIHELAEYERLAHEVVATEAALREGLFGTRPGAEAVIARSAGEPAGFALFFQNFSTFLGKPGIYLEDLFVRPAFRGQGLGKAMLAYLARLALERGCGRFEWAVLDWNRSARDFYENLGAEPKAAWINYRLTGSALSRLADRGEA